MNKSHEAQKAVAVPHSTDQVEDIVLQANQAITGDTRRSILDLSVELRGDTVVLKGRVERYYPKQMAQQAVIDLVHAKGFQLLNEIEVMPSAPSVRDRDRR